MSVFTFERLRERLIVGCALTSDRHDSKKNSWVARTKQSKYRILEDRVIVAQDSWIIPKKESQTYWKPREVATEYPQVQFVIIGESSHRAEFTALIEKLGY